MSAVHTLVPEAPSAADALSEYRKYAPKMSVYNAAPEWFTAEYGGNHYYLPPDVDGALVPHPVEVERYPDGEPRLDENQNLIPLMVRGDGECKIGTLFGWTYDRFGRNTGMDLIKGHEAFYIVIFLQRAYAFRGIVWLREPGSVKDEQRKAQAKRLYRQHMRTWAAEQVGSFQTTVNNFRRQPGHQQMPQPQPNHAQLKAQEYLDNYHETQDDTFSCSLCLGYYSKDFNKYANHMRAAHKMDVKPGDIAPVARPATVAKADEVENETARALAAAAAAASGLAPVIGDPSAISVGAQLQEVLEASAKLQAQIEELKELKESGGGRKRRGKK